jgi:hypothetical protein
LDQKDSLPLLPSAFSKPWESPEYSQFFASDIGQDIKALPPSDVTDFRLTLRVVSDAG